MSLWESEKQDPNARAISLQSCLRFDMGPQAQQPTATTSSLKRAIYHALYTLPLIATGVFLIAAAVDGKPEGALMGLAALGIGFFPARKVYRAVRQWRTFGTSHLQVETAVVPLGSPLRARVRVPVSPDRRPLNGFQIHVAGYRAKGIITSRKKQVWEDSTCVHGESVGGETTVVPVSFDLPAETRTEFCRLTVAASFEEMPDYEASFDLAVSASDDGDEQSAERSTEAPDGPTDPTEEAYWNVDGDDTRLHRTADETGARDTKGDGTDKEKTSAE